MSSGDDSSDGNASRPKPTERSALLSRRGSRDFLKQTAAELASGEYSRPLTIPPKPTPNASAVRKANYAARAALSEAVGCADCLLVLNVLGTAVLIVVSMATSGRVHTTDQLLVDKYNAAVSDWEAPSIGGATTFGDMAWWATNVKTGKKLRLKKDTTREGHSPIVGISPDSPGINCATAGACSSYTPVRWVAGVELFETAAWSDAVKGSYQTIQLEYAFSAAATAPSGVLPPLPMAMVDTYTHTPCAQTEAKGEKAPLASPNACGAKCALAKGDYAPGGDGGRCQFALGRVCSCLTVKTSLKGSSLASQVQEFDGSVLGYAADSASSQYNFSGLKLDHGALNAADCCVAPITPVQRYFGMTELQGFDAYNAKARAAAAYGSPVSGLIVRSQADPLVAALRLSKFTLFFGSPLNVGYTIKYVVLVGLMLAPGPVFMLARFCVIMFDLRGLNVISE